MRKIILLAAMMIVTFFAASQKHETFLQRIKQKTTSSFSGTSIKLEFQAKAIEDPESIWGNIEGLHEVTIEAACKVENALWVVGKLENNTKLFVAKSTDSGVTWQKKDKGLPFIAAQTIEKHNGRLFITVGDNEIYASDDDGENWYLLSQLPPSTFSSNWFTNVMASNASTLFLAAWAGGTELDEIFYSNNNGQSWQSTGYQSFQTSQNAWKLFGIEYYNGKLYAFDDSMGVVIYDIATNAWIRPTNLNKPQSFYTLKIADSGILYAGAEGGLYYSVDAAQSWQRVPTPQKNNINYVTGLTIENEQVFFTIHEEIPLLQSNGNLYTFKEGYAQTVKQLGQNIPYSATLILANDKKIYLPILYEQDGMLTLNMPEANHEGSKLLLTSTNGKLFSINEYGENFEILQSDFGSYVQPVLIQKRDGTFYVNNIANPGNNNNFQNQLYTISVDGSQKQLIYSGYLQNTNPAFYFGTAIIESSDGNLYGVATKANTRSQFFRLTPQGQYTNLFDFPLDYNNGKVVIQSIMQASDGNFYGAMGWALDNNVNPNFSTAIFKIDASNYAFTVLKTFPFTPANQLDVERVFGVITEGNDGYLYTTSQEGGVYKAAISYSGTIIRIRKDGTDYSIVYQFGQNYDHEIPNSEFPIIMSNDGYLYAGSGINGGQNNYGFICRMKSDGSDFQYLKHFSQDEQVFCGGLKQLPSGRIAGALQIALNGDGGIFTMNPDGSNYYYIKQFDAASGILQPYSYVLIREPQQVTFPVPTPRQVGDVFELVATSSSGLPVSFTSSNPNIVSINGTTATVHAAGEVTITAKAAGNAVYLEAYDVSNIIIALPDFDFEIWGKTSTTTGADGGAFFKINNTGKHDTYTIPGILSSEIVQALDGAAYAGVSYYTGQENSPDNFNGLYKLNLNGTYEKLIDKIDVLCLLRHSNHSVYGFGRTLDSEEKVIAFRINGSNFFELADFDFSTDLLFPSMIELPNSKLAVTIGKDLYTLNTDGTDKKLIYETTIGSNISASFEHENYIYGIVTNFVGSPPSQVSGFVYKIGLDGSNFSVIRNFNNRYFQGKLTLSNESIYGVFQKVGVEPTPDSDGGIFKIMLKDNSYSDIHLFNDEIDGLYGAGWWGKLEEMPDGALYSASYFGGSSPGDGGFIFRIKNDVFERVYDFKGSNLFPALHYVSLIRQPQTITFNPIGNKQIGDVFELVATSSSGLPVTFTSSNPNIVSINGTTATVHAAGEVTITAKAAGNDVYLDAYDITQVFSTSRLTQTIIFNAIGNKQIGDVFELVATSSSGLPVTFTSSNPNIVSINGTTATVHAAGEVTITAKAAGNDVYLDAYDVTQVFSTSRLTQTITFNAIGNKQIGDVFDLVATSSSGLPVTFTSSNPNIVSINGATATVLAAGEVTLTAKQGGNDVYLQASDVTQNLLVVVLDVQPVENFYISEPYPNPNDGTCINFNIKQPSGVSLNIYLNTLLGSELGNTTLFANGEDEKVCIASNLKQGTYLVSIKSSTGFVKVYKVVVP